MMISALTSQEGGLHRKLTCVSILLSVAASIMGHALRRIPACAPQGGPVQIAVFLSVSTPVSIMEIVPTRILARKHCISMAVLLQI
jgi:hypothetical protein